MWFTLCQDICACPHGVLAKKSNKIALQVCQKSKNEKELCFPNIDYYFNWLIGVCFFFSHKN